MSNMSSTCKYSNLPGIAFDQPDVYETKDVLELELSANSNASQMAAAESSNKLMRQHVNQLLLETIDKKSDSVEKITTKPQDAFNHFKGKYLRVDRSHASGIQLGYQTYGEWQINDSKDNETPLQKYYRLKAEMEELSQTLQKVDASQLFEPNISTDLKPSDISDNLEFMKQQLGSMQIEENSQQSLLFSDLSKNQTVLSDLQQKLQDAKHKPVDEESKKTSSSTNQAATYELFCDPKLNQLSELSRNQRLEQRIHRLENVLGEDLHELQKLPNLGSDKSLAEIVTILSSKISQLDANHLEQIDSRLTSLLHKFNQINEKKSELPELDKQNKISELYDVLTQMDEKRSVLPSVISRLKCVEDLQQKAIYFSQVLSHLDTIQNQVSNSVEANQDELNVLKEAFDSNMRLIREMVQSLEKRIDRLTSK